MRRRTVDNSGVYGQRRAELRVHGKTVSAQAVEVQRAGGWEVTDNKGQHRTGHDGGEG